MPIEGNVDAPIATILNEDPRPEPTEDAAPVAIPAEPKRRRVRRKVAVETATVSDIDAADETPQPAELDVAPSLAAKVEQAIEAALEDEPDAAAQAVVIVESKPAPKPEADLSSIIADDPNQITAPPAKPKRGWWRR